jgi:hypothetical protein
MSFQSERIAENIAKGTEKLMEETLGFIGDAEQTASGILDTLSKEQLYQREVLGKYMKALRDLEEGFEGDFQEATAEDFAESLEHPNLHSARGNRARRRYEDNTPTVQVWRESDEADKVFPVGEKHRAAIMAWLSEG